MYDKTIVERKSYAASKLTAPNHIWGIDITSPQYIDRLRDANAQISMDARRRSVDNIFTERLWRTFKLNKPTWLIMLPQEKRVNALMLTSISTIFSVLISTGLSHTRSVLPIFSNTAYCSIILS